jgi:hypothetical protein
LCKNQGHHKCFFFSDDLSIHPPGTEPVRIPPSVQPERMVIAPKRPYDNGQDRQYGQPPNKKPFDFSRVGGNFLILLSPQAIHQTLLFLCFPSYLPKSVGIFFFFFVEKSVSFGLLTTYPCFKAEIRIYFKML